MSSEARETSSLRNADNLRSTISDSGSNNVAKESSQSSTIEQKLASKMFSYATEIICFILAVMFTALAALHSSPPKISKPPAARPFFNQSSIVLDFYKGHLSAMIERVTDTEFSFVMYYAPWDAESQVIRDEFEKVAEYYYPQIFFTAINCWHPNSECRAQYNKIQSYPVLILYPARDSGIQYRGIRTAPYMIRFLHAFINPIIRITNKEYVKQLLVTYDAVIVGYFNFTGVATSPGYKEFYKSAIRSLEKDPNREVAFAAVTNALSSQSNYGVIKSPSASLFMWNETLNYPDDKEWTPENILNWITNSIHQPTLWLQPPGIKALTLAPYLREGPVFFLFTPRNPLHYENYNYNLIREVGLQYYNCANNLLVKDIITRLQHKRYTAMSRYIKKNEKCTYLVSESEMKKNEPTISVSVQQWINSSCCAKIFMNKCVLCKKEVLNSVDRELSCTSIHEKNSYVCKKIDIFTIPLLENTQTEQEFCCNQEHISINLHENVNLKSSEYKISQSDENDRQSPIAIKHALLKENCKRSFAAHRYHEPVFPQDSFEKSNISLIKSLCNINRTLSLIAIDSLHYFHFAEGLGIDVLKKKDKTAAIILDVAQESEYVMQKDFNKNAVIEFINNYTQGFLQRTLRSDNSRCFVQKFKTKIKCDQKNTLKMCIPDLTSETFLDTILDATKDVVVLYYSPYCAFCSAISYVYLMVAHYLFAMDHLIFVRIDGDNNDLPWEYSMDRFPSILFFPARRKEDSTVFPFSLPINIPNLLNYVLANLDGDSRVEALTNICLLSASDPPDKCIVRIRWLCLEIIEQLLHDYRKLRRHLNFIDQKTARNKKKIILLKLEHIRYIHLILGSTIDLAEDQHIVHIIRKRFREYYRILRLLELDSKIISNKTRIMRIVQKVNTPKGKILKNEL
ncbi:thioredoxin domain-containing protein 11-like isoform X1 [Vespa mandarinia]|uniref:thioredoxin domain-containing protein 11-like isoform X1 n=2 Tax=Vespa mandarinia TaxID=7446 RepID=UPI00160BE57A|nr:thioredoxin domain-containing protein 11-like isoform X1 [Vespa mandarinia]